MTGAEGREKRGEQHRGLGKSIETPPTEAAGKKGKEKKGKSVRKRQRKGKEKNKKNRNAKSSYHIDRV